MVNNNRLFGKIGLSLMESWKMFEIDSFEDLELCEIIFENKIG
jgi:CMP-N-acetylneuraminic acid synthetase